MQLIMMTIETEHIQRGGGKANMLKLTENKYIRGIMVTKIVFYNKKEYNKIYILQVR